MNIVYLIGLEWKKYKNYRLFQILIIAYLVLLPASILSMVGKEIGVGLPFDTVSVYTFPDIWKYLAYCGNWLSFFIVGFAGVITITNEHTYRTFRQNIICGLSRTDFFLAKLYSLLFVTLLLTLYFALVGYLIGSLYTRDPQWDEISEHIGSIPNFALVTIAYGVYGMVLGVVLRRTGFALFLYLVLGMFVERIIRHFIHNNIIENGSMNYYPFNGANDLTPWPIDLLRKSMEVNNKNIFLTIPQAQITVWIFIVIFLGIMYWHTSKSDL